MASPTAPTAPEVTRVAGTSLATHDAAAMRRFPSYRLEHTSRVATEWLARRVQVVVPHVTLQLTLLHFAGLPHARLAAMASVHALHIATLLYWQWSLRRGADTATVAFRSNLAVMALHAPLLVLTGGLPGPLAPSLLGVLTGSMVAFGRSARSWITLGITVALVPTIALASHAIGLPRLSAAWASAVAAESVLFSVLMLATIVMRLTGAYEAAGEALDAARTELIDDAQSRARSLESVGARVAHELKNPLAAIKALVSLAASTPREDKRAERLRIASEEIERMESLLRAYLEFERPLEALQRASVDLAGIASEAVALLGDRASLASVTLALDAPDEVRLSLDARRMKSAIIDVVSNAIEASPRGSTVTVQVHRAAEGARVDVVDQGRGMAPHELARLGTAFFTTRENGTGLGVVLARLAATQHGGALTYESEPGRGTRARFTLPAAEAA